MIVGERQRRKCYFLVWSVAARQSGWRLKPETFKFLGLVLICDKSRRGDFHVRRKSRGDRMCATLQAIKEALRRRTNRPNPERGKWLASVVSGYFAYHAVPTNGLALAAFRYHVTVLWHRQ